MWIVFLLITSVRMVAFHKETYAQFYERENMAEQLQVSQSKLESRIYSLLDYIQLKQDTIDSVFNEREVKHMKDVRSLYREAIQVQYACLIILLIGQFYFYKKVKYYQSYLARGMLQASFCFLIGFFMLAFWAYTDFGDFWYRIHTLFFTNDLWILDPATDFMILLCPEELFLSLTVRGTLCFFTLFILANGISGWFLMKKSVIGFDKFD